MCFVGGGIGGDLSVEAVGEGCWWWLSVEAVGGGVGVHLGPVGGTSGPIGRESVESR